MQDIVTNKSRVFPYLVEQIEKAPFALKKLQQQALAERFLIVTKPEELPQGMSSVILPTNVHPLDIKKAVNQAQLTYDIVNKNWEPFCLVVRLLFHKRLVPSQEAADGCKEKDAQEAAALAHSQVPIDKEHSGIRNDEPKKVFNPRKLQLSKQACVVSPLSYSTSHSVKRHGIYLQYSGAGPVAVLHQAHLQRNTRGDQQQSTRVLLLTDGPAPQCSSLHRRVREQQR